MRVACQVSWGSFQPSRRSAAMSSPLQHLHAPQKEPEHLRLLLQSLYSIRSERLLVPDIFRGEKRRNATHRSLTDPQARLARKAKGQPSVLAHSLHFLTENRHGLIVDLEVTEANGRAERDAALVLVRRSKRRRRRMKTIAADRGYDAGAFLLEVEAEGVTPMVAIRKGKIRSTTPAAVARKRARRRQRTKAYAISNDNGNGN